jgi:hypothetical protein
MWPGLIAVMVLCQLAIGSVLMGAAQIAAKSGTLYPYRMAFLVVLAAFATVAFFGVVP